MDTNQGTPEQFDPEAAQKLFEQEFSKIAKSDTVPAVVATPAPAEPAPVVVATTTEPVVAEVAPVTTAVTTAQTTEPVKKEDVHSGDSKNAPASAGSKAEPVVTEQKREYGVPDWAKELPDNIKEQLSKELQEKLYYEKYYKSEQGRQAGLQRKLYKERQENAALRARVAKPPDPIIDAAKKQDESKELEYWNQLQKAEPNLANAIEARLKAESAQNKSDLQSKLEATVNPLIQHNEESYEDTQRRLLMDVVPNFVEVVASPVYDRWLKTRASPGLRDLAHNSLDHQDAISVLRAYQTEGQSVYEQMVRDGEIQAPAQVVQAAPAKVADTSRADEVAKSREQKLNAAPVVTNVPNPIGNPSGTSLENYRHIGGKIDIEDASVIAAFEDAYKKNLRQR